MRLAVCGQRSTTILDVHSGRHLATIKCKPDLHGCVWVPADRYRLAIQHDRMIDVWTEGTDESYTKLKPVYALKTGIGSPEPGTSFYSGSGDVLLGFARWDQYHIWNMTAAGRRDHILDHAQHILALAVHSAPGPLCVATATDAYDDRSSKITVWTCNDAGTEWAKETVQLPSIHDVVHLAFSADGRTLTVCTFDIIKGIVQAHRFGTDTMAAPGSRSISLSTSCSWRCPALRRLDESPADGDREQSLFADEIQVLCIRESTRYWTALSPRGTYVAYTFRDDRGGRKVYLCRVRDGRLLNLWREPAGHGQVRDLVFSPDEEVLVYSLEDGSVIIRRIRHFVSIL